ncbi:MAG: hypothetical protein IJP82_03410 [Bacteroidaceae bacterium]|nr:hypothetical protein [Bacteroidaceae bacterium]
MMNIKELIEDPSKLNAETLPELKALVEKYPFFQAVRLLYLSNLYRLHSQDFGPELKRASVHVPDRTALFALTEGVNYELPSQNSATAIETEGDSNRTLSLINTFLTQGGIETDNDFGPERNQPSVADLTNDYVSYLMRQEQQGTPEEPDDISKADDNAPRLKGADLIDIFIEETKGKQRLDMPEMNDEEFTSPELSAEEEEIYTENMVNIYIKQGRYQQALEILRKICLNNPKKSSNFAAEMNLLEIILGEQNIKKPNN